MQYVIAIVVLVIVITMLNYLVFGDRAWDGERTHRHFYQIRSKREQKATLLQKEAKQPVLFTDEESIPPLTDLKAPLIRK